ncbi:MAG: molybdopterin-dependent oxidoreductase [Bacillota bacterium]|nr:molybdopterin-dependent oxidoreductase [Bacillota bacterium]
MSWQNERIDLNVYSQGEVDKWVYSTCNICSVGCGCHIAVKNEKIVGIKGNPSHPINRGRLGPKGEHQWQANNSPDRLVTPLIRNREGELIPSTWDEAMNVIVSKTKEVLKEKGGNGIAIYSTGQGFLEGYYTIAKIGRAGLGTHLLDANTRLCTATTEFCLLQSFGSDGVPASFDDIDVTETLLLFGHNPAETGTVLFERIMERKKRVGKPYIIVVDPRQTLTAREADLHLQLYPGTNVALLNGLLNFIIKNDLIDRDFIDNHTIGYEKMRASLKEWTLEQTAEITGIPEDLLHTAAKRLGNTSSLVTTTLQGIYQSADATTACVAINNMHLVRGLIGKPGCGPLHMAGQPSSSANRTAGGVGTYPANRNSSNPMHIQEMAKLWNVEESMLPVGPEKGIEEQIEMMENGEIGLFWNIGTNPMVSLPNRRRARKAFENTFVVVQDPFITETSAVADVILPAALWGEKEGTMENADRTINLLRKAVEPPNGVKSDFNILLDFAKRMDFRDLDGGSLIKYTTPEECFEEWKTITVGRPCEMTGITYDKLEQHNGLRWPVNEKNPEGKVRLYEDFNFHTKVDDAQSFTKNQFTGRPLTQEEYEKLEANGRAILHPTVYLRPAEVPNSNYPLWLTTGRLVWHWHTRTKTARSPYLQAAAPNAYAEINVEDATKLGLVEGEYIKISSPRGEIEVPARIGNCVQKGLVFVPFHFGSWDKRESANELTADFTDPLSKQPTFKQSSCRIEKIRTAHVVSVNQGIESIAKQFGINVENLKKANGLHSLSEVEAGTKLEIPLSIINVPIPEYLPFK